MYVAHTYLFLAVEYDKGESLVHGALEGGLDGHDSLLVSQSVERCVLHLQDLLTHLQWGRCRLSRTALRLYVIIEEQEIGENLDQQFHI